MKRKLFMAIAILVLLFACQDEETNYQLSHNETSIDNGMNIVYPLSKEFQSKTSQTRSNLSSFEDNWENIQEVTTAYGNTLKLPWSSLSDANIPFDLVADIKKEDGWQLLFHTFNGTDIGAKDRNYMAFYNQRTGVFKVFYYLLNAPQYNNAAAWDLSFTTAQKLLNITPEIAIPINIGEINYWACTNAVTAGNKGFAQGWNCFQTTFAYDPNNYTDRRIEINSHLLNTTDANLLGENNSYSKGTILTYGSANPLSGLTGDLATVFGADAEKWVSDAITKGDVKEPETSTRNLISGGVGAIVKFGINNIFSKLTATFSKPTITKSDLEFTTRGTTTTTGQLTFNSNSPALSLRIPFNKQQVGELGVWSLINQPTVYIDPRADYMPTDSDIGYKEYWYKLRGVSRYQYDLLINPELKPHIIKQWVDISLIRYWPEKAAPVIPDYYTDFGTLGQKMKGFGEYCEEENLIYGKHLKENSIYKQDMRGRLYVSNLYSMYQGPIPVVLVPKVESYESHYFNSKNIFMKMSLYMITDFNGKQDTTLSTRTFIPKIEWDQKLYDQLKGIPMPDLHHYDWIK